MELITILRVLSRHKSVVAVSCVVSIGVGAVVGFRVSILPPQLNSRAYQVGSASTEVLIDTPRSTVAALSPAGSDTLLSRTSLLANLMATSPLQALIAKQANVPAAQLTIIPPATSTTAVPTPMATASAKTAPASGGGYELNVTTNATLPLISLSAQAPKPSQAARLADGAVLALQTYLGSVDRSQRIPLSERTVVQPLGPAQAAAVTRGTGKVYAVLAAFVSLILLSALIVIVAGGRRASRTAADRDRAAADRDRAAADGNRAAAGLDRADRRPGGDRRPPGLAPESAGGGKGKGKAVTTRTKSRKATVDAGQVVAKASSNGHADKPGHGDDPGSVG